MLPEDLAVELAEDREWEAIKDAVEQGHKDLDGYGENEPHDEPEFRFADEEGTDGVQ